MRAHDPQVLLSVLSIPRTTLTPPIVIHFATLCPVRKPSLQRTHTDNGRNLLVSPGRVTLQKKTSCAGKASAGELLDVEHAGRELQVICQGATCELPANCDACS